MIQMFYKSKIIFEKDVSICNKQNKEEKYCQKKMELPFL